MNLKKRVLMVLVMLLLISTLTACEALIGNSLEGEWEYEHNWMTTYTFIESGKHYTYLTLNGKEKGKFTIIGDEIRFRPNHGSVRVESFSRTEDGIIIGGKKFIKKK